MRNCQVSEFHNPIIKQNKVETQDLQDHKSVLVLDHLIEKGSESSYRITYPGVEKENNFYKFGMVTKNDYTFNLSEYFGLTLEILTEKDNDFHIIIDLLKDQSPKAEYSLPIHKSCSTAEAGRIKLLLSFKEFDLVTSGEYNLQFARGFRIEGAAPFQLVGAGLTKGRSIALTSDIQSRAIHKNDTAFYETNIYNCENKEILVTFEHKKYGWEEMPVIVPEPIRLGAYEWKTICIAVQMSPRVAVGGYETQTILATPNGQGALREKIAFKTSMAMPYPHVLMDDKEYEEVKEKIRKFNWAKETYDRWLNLAYEWKVPDIDTNKDYLFLTRNAHEARGAAVMYKLSGDKELALKVITFLKELSDPNIGYLRLPRACNQELVHEGEFFKSVAIAYDIVHDLTELTTEDHENIEAVFRYFIKFIDIVLKNGNISNWSLAEICGALYCSAVLQDLHWIERFLYGVGAATEHLSKGVLGDGWWYEASIGYNLLAAGLFSEIAQVVSHFGINFKDIAVPASYSKSVSSANLIQDGLVIDSWGENNGNYRTIDMLWDSLVPFYDYRGVIFGINDSSEMKVEGISHVLFDSRYDIAFYLYRKPEYAYLMRNVKSTGRDLLFGVGELPFFETEEKPYQKSCYADNAGAAVLRSHKKGRPDREQIQIGLKYGSHGGAHGHYDRVSMTSLMRYGRSVTGPENIWYSYHTMMYKFYVQNSIAHNIVTVDLKQQDPREPRNLMFYSGERMQAMILENFGKWCNPPFGGWQVNNDKTLEERSWNEGRFVPVPVNPPEYATRSGFTEDIVTGRLTVVMDDYVVNFDYAVGDDIHNYDCLYHLQGLKETEGLHFIKHTEKLDESPLSSGQFITDCNHYEIREGGKLSFFAEYTEEINNGDKWLSKNKTAHNEYGIIKTDLHLAYPPKADVIIGCDPEYDAVNKQLQYKVYGDEKCLASGQFGAWILGKDRIDVNVSGMKTIGLMVHVNDVEFEDGIVIPSKDTIFWGNPYFVLEDDSMVYLSELSLKYENTKIGYGIGKDYEGGEVKIQAELFEKAIPAEPADRNQDGLITIDISDLPVKRFVSFIGGDYPLGDDSGKRRTVALRVTDKIARFVTVLELYEETSLIEKVDANDPNSVKIWLKDGRIQTLKVKGLVIGKDIEVKLEEQDLEGNLITEIANR